MIHPSTLRSVDITAVGNENQECVLHKMAAVEHFCRVTWFGAVYHDKVEGDDMVASDGTPYFDAAATGGAFYGTWVTVDDAEDATRTAAEWRCEGTVELEDGLVLTPADPADIIT